MAKHTRPWEPNWTVERELGKGGQGTTYLVSSVANPTQKAVLKRLKNKGSIQSRARMHREVASLRSLAAEGARVPAVKDENTNHVEDTSIELFVVMDHVPGATLDALVKQQGPLPIETAAAIVRNLCETLRIAHGFPSPILHRDLKPDNIIVRDLASADVVVIDYGLAFNHDENPITQAGETFRNKFLDLPETVVPGGNRRDMRSDITAACAVLYYCLTGHQPGHLQDERGNLPHRRPGKTLKECNPEAASLTQLEVFFDRGFSPNIENRFQTIEELLERLELAVAVGSESKPDDPRAVAARCSARIRKYDRVTQLKGFDVAAAELLEALFRNATEISADLGQFALTADQASNEMLAVPAGYDLLRGLQCVLQIQHHERFKGIAYAVASKGEQCTVFRLEGRSEGIAQGFFGSVASVDYSGAPARQVFSYNGDTAPDTSDLLQDFSRWLNAAMESLTGEIAEQQDGRQ